MTADLAAKLTRVREISYGWHVTLEIHEALGLLADAIAELARPEHQLSLLEASVQAERRAVIAFLRKQADDPTLKGYGGGSLLHEAATRIAAGLHLES